MVGVFLLLLVCVLCLGGDLKLAGQLYALVMIGMIYMVYSFFMMLFTSVIFWVILVCIIAYVSWWFYKL